MSDLEDNTFKISVPIITNEELERFEYSLETDLDNIVNEISTHISRDREIILLKKVIEKLRTQNKKYSELIIKLRNLSSGVVSYEIINGKKYYGPRKNFSKQRLYEKFLKMKLLLKSEYIFLSNEDYLKELEKE